MIRHLLPAFAVIVIVFGANNAPAPEPTPAATVAPYSTDFEPLDTSLDIAEVCEMTQDGATAKQVLEALTDQSVEQARQVGEILAAYCPVFPVANAPRPAPVAVTGAFPLCPTEDSNTTANGQDCFWRAPLGGRSFYVISGHVRYVFGTNPTNMTNGM